MLPREPGKNEEVMPETGEIEKLKKALADEKAKADTYLDGWQRERADFLNYKRRVEQEREEVIKYAAWEVLLRILPALDDLDRAFENVPPAAAESGWAEGIRAIGRKLRSILEAQGVVEIKALGEPFDPNLHEAVMTSKGKEDMVIKEIQKGYKLHNRVLRPTKVIVGDGEDQKEA